MSLPFFIARHLYTGGDGQQKVSRPAVRIAMLGIAIGMATMIVSICVVLGFKHTIRDKIVGFGSHIVVSNYMTLQTPDLSHPINAEDSLVGVLRGIRGVRHVQRYAQKQGVLKTDSDFLGVMFKGIGEDYDTTFLAKNIVAGTMPRLSMERSTRQLLISKTMADKLHITPGDKVFAYFLGTDDDVRARSFTVTGIYQTNLTRYDESFCFTDLYTVSRLNGWQCIPDERLFEVAGVELLVSQFDSIPAVADDIVAKVNKTVDTSEHPLSSATIQELSPQIFSWLDLLDLNVWIIIVLMICVSGVTMISGLLIIILERSSMIGILKALGARNAVVRRTFRWLALFIVLKGMLWGNVLGVGFCLLQQYTGIVKLDPATYYVSEAPVEINIPLLLLLNVVTLLVTIAALVLPSTLVSTIQPAKSMKIE
ncbi:MAG: ABC transporter permease [Prevotellaceae bacterium]|nr:ABC transporter permease [Prevotellaceae bacterium]MDO4932667.1 ABC transporter permease [Prevotellaceae bacterium]